MSNFLAVATVTEVVRQMLDTAVSTDVSGAKATAVKPTGTTSSGLPPVGVNVYLYQVNPNPAWRNADLPTRRQDGTMAQLPRVALDLHYLLTFYGQETQLQPQRVLGSAARVLHAHPILLRQQIRGVIDALVAGDAAHYLKSSDLDQEVELVKFSPMLLSLEEVSKLWSVFFQTTYTLSLTYQASVVMIEGKGMPQVALPVRERKVVPVPFQPPVLESVSPQVAQPGGTLTLRGRNLAAPLTRVVFDTGEVVEVGAGAEALHLPVPTTLQAGVRTVRVRHDLHLGTNREPHAGYSSNALAFALAPLITTLPAIRVARGATLALSVSPAVGRVQDVALLLSEQVIPIPPRPQSDPPAATTLAFPIPATFPAGTYLARVQVDGVPSPLAVDNNLASPTYGQYVGPTVEVT